MEWVVGIQVDADAWIFYVHMDDLKHCAPPDPEPSWPDVARGTSIVVSMRAPYTLAPTDIVQSHQASGSAFFTLCSTEPRIAYAFILNIHCCDDYKCIPVMPS